MRGSLGFISCRFIAAHLWLVCAGAVCADDGGYQKAQAAKAEVTNGIVLRADHSGHFRGKLWVNGKELPFLIDTGATVIAIPMKFALEARLPFGSQVDMATAGGRTIDKQTVIDSLVIGDTELKHVEAVLNQHLTEILLGMNTLRFFKMTQSGDLLTLQLNKQLIKQNHLEDRVTALEEARPHSQGQPVTDYYVSPNPITKSVECDSRNHCVTRFGN
ncbi:retropepsin-like aspartic protease family protein [Methylomonas sp. HW2-6]|uniref:retropepsin-like aspartic protease family protein n=1 Tax=Methylomonas sp. HW2-6 TaxID=3376687 RepID=UPI0040429953